MVQWITLSGLSEYLKTLTLMENRVSEIIAGNATETIYLVEHSDTYTAGSSFKPEELLDTSNIPVIYTGRGGKFTYHGKGQRVIYPLLDLSLAGRSKDIKLYIKLLEQWIINILNQFGVKAFIIENKVGIWVKYLGQEAKIASIGIRIKKWITYHGIAINLTTDLDKFNGIVPCGISDAPPISLKMLGIDIDFHQFDQILKQEFHKIF